VKGTFVELALGGQFVVGVLFQFLDLHVALVAFLLELFLEEEERFVHLAHILLFAGDPCLFFFVNSFSGI
jgi:hypothetical protein